MAEPSVYHKLNNNNAILSVFKDQVNISRAEDTLSAIGNYDLHGCSCVLAMGTTPGSAIVFARISQLLHRIAGSSRQEHHRRTLPSLGHDEHFMSLVRRVINIMMSNHELFQVPVVYGIFGQYQGDILLEHLREKTETVFAHLNIKLHSSFYEIPGANDILQSPKESTVVAVQHPAKLPELYVGDQLAYPASYSGSLASACQRLGLEHIDHDNAGNHDGSSLDSEHERVSV